MALPQKHRYAPVWLMFCTGIVLSVVSCTIVWKWETENRKTQFQNQADRLATALQQSINSNLEILQATGQLYTASENVNRQEFKAFVKDFLVRYPSVSGFNWTRRVRATERQAFEQAIQAEGYPSFQISERNAQGKLVRAGQRPEYFSVTYTEPLQVQRSALGFDLASEPMRRAALEKARDTGTLSTTRRITIVTTHQLGFLTFQPIYRKGASLDTLQGRRENFQGLTTAVFQIGDIVKAALPGLELDKIDFYLFDNSADVKDRFLSFYQSSKKQVIADPSHEQPVNMARNSLCSNQAACTRVLTVADRQWLLLVLPAPGYIGIQTHWGAWITLAIGLLLTILLSIYLLMSLRHTVQVEQLVSERTAQAKQLSQTLKSLQLNMEMLDLANDSIIIRDLNNRIIYWNRGAERLYGWKKIEVLGENSHSFLQTVFPKPLNEIMTLFLKQGHWEGELIHTKQDGLQIMVESRWTLQRDESGQITAMLEINNDITERKQALAALHYSEEREREKAKQLEQALYELQKTQAQLIQTEKMSSLGQLVAGVAHEINNPVNFIYGNLTHANEYTQELLEIVRLYQQHYPLPVPEIQEQVEDIDINFIIEDLPKILSSMKVGAERIRHIVLSLRNFSRLDEAEMKLVDIHEGIDSTLLILQNRLKAKPDHPGTQVIKEYGNLPLVECYAGQLNQVFMNILTNAIDALDSYNSQRSAEEIQRHPSTIKISTKVLNTDRVVVQIADNGLGMTEEVKKRLFNPFFTTKPVGKGTGLGLSISYQIIVEKHAGVLRCESALGQGTEFWIEIPVKQSQKTSTNQLETVLTS